MLRAAIRQREVPSDRHGLIKAIHAMGRDLNLNDETRKELQWNLTGVESCKDMTLPQLKQVYQRVSVLHDTMPPRLHPPKRRGRDERQPEELLSVEQNRMICHLFDDLSISGIGLARMNFCRRTCGSTWPQTRAQGNKIIEALKAMRDRGWKGREEAGAGAGSALADRAGDDAPRSTRAVEPTPTPVLRGGVRV